MERIFTEHQPNRRAYLLIGVCLLGYLVCSCKGTAQPASGEHVVTIDPLPVDRGGRSRSGIGSTTPINRNISVTSVPEATFSGFPGERVIVGGEEKRIWSTSPRGAASVTPVPTYQIYPYVILPSDKTR